MSEVSEILSHPDGWSSPIGDPGSNLDTSQSTSIPVKKPKSKARTAWQNAIRTTKSRIDTKRPTSSGRSRYRSVSPDAKTEARVRGSKEQRECEKDRSDTPADDPVVLLQEELQVIKQKYEDTLLSQKELQTKSETHANQATGLKVDIKEKETLIDRLRRENETKAAIITNIRKELKEATEKVRGVTNMEWKAMEYEKVTIMNENLKQKLDTQISENRDLERKLREREKEIEEKDTRMETSEARIEELNEKMLDLRLQVREEAIKNTRLDEQVEQLATAQRLLQEKEDEVDKLQKELEDTKLLLQHAKKSWKEERDKIKEFEDSDKQDKLKEEDMELTKSENMTLKRLIVAKDALLIQKSQTLENIKNLLNQQENDHIGVSTVRRLLQTKPVIKPTFPRGNKSKVELSNGFKDEDYTDGLTQTSDKRHQNKKGKLLHNLLGEEWLTSALSNGHFSRSSDTRAVSPRRPKTAVVRPTTYSTSSFSNFRSSTNSVDNREGMKRWNTTKELRTDRSDSNQSNSSKSQSDVLDSSKLRRSKSAENRIHLQDSSPRPSSAGTWSQKSMSISTVGSLGSSCVSATLLNAAPKKDRRCAKVIRTGDRVVVDMGKVKEKRKLDFHSGVIKFIGNLDKEHDCYRIYIGIRLDDPVGDTDGIYKGKRYFKVTANHGKFVRITRIQSVYDRESFKYEDIDTLIEKLEQDIENENDVDNKRNFSLDL